MILKHTEQSKEKLRKSHTGILNEMYEKHLGEEARLELSASRIGVSFSEEHKRKIADSNRGKTMTEQSKQKIREARKKQVMSKWTPERREKFKQTWRQKKERQNEQVEN